MIGCGCGCAFPAKRRKLGNGGRRSEAGLDPGAAPDIPCRPLGVAGSCQAAFARPTLLAAR